MPTPTPEPPGEMPRPPPPATRCVSSVALIVMSCDGPAVIVWLTCAPSSIAARVFRSKMSTTAEAPTAASPVPAPPAIPNDVTNGPVLMIGRMICSGEIDAVAVIVSAPATLTIAPVRALLLTMTTLRPTAAPTFFDPDDPPDPPPEPPPEPPPDPPLEPPDPPVSSDSVGILMLVAVPFAVASVWFCALMITAPVRAVTVRPSAIRAVFVEMTTFTLIAAATPVPPDDVPEFPPEDELAWLVFELNDGIENPERPPPDPLLGVFGLPKSDEDASWSAVLVQAG